MRGGGGCRPRAGASSHADDASCVATVVLARCVVVLLAVGSCYCTVVAARLVVVGGGTVLVRSSTVVL